MSRRLARFLRWCTIVPRQALRDAHELRRRRRRRANGINAFEEAVYSQNGEDGILRELFRRLGITQGVFVEFGVEDGLQCNAANLAREAGWRGLFIEASPVQYRALERNYRDFPAVQLKKAFVTRENIGSLLSSAGIPEQFDLLSVDIDGNDYWVWERLATWHPSVVVIEYNATYPPPVSIAMPYDPDYVWDGTTYFGASLSALVALGDRLNYAFVGTESRGINAFFVRRDLLPQTGFRELTPEEGYHPARISMFRTGHPWRAGRYVAVPVLLGALLLSFTSCGGGGGGGSGGSVAALPPPAAGPPPSTATGPLQDDWTTFAHDQLRTGYQPQETGITPQNVAQLKLKWQYHVPAGEHASPIVSDGSVYLFSDDGFVLALDAASGKLKWQTAVGFNGRMTPALADGMLFVGAYNGPPNFFALDAQSGATRWEASLPGWVRAEPVIANGVVYEGSSGGDLPFCNQGGMFAFNERTGSQLWSWFVTAVPSDGGSVWAPITFDGKSLIFGTGNTCNKIADGGDAVISLNLDGTQRWEWDQPRWDSRVDNDTGGGALTYNGAVYIPNKDASLYALSESTGSTLWSMYTGGFQGYGSIGTPTTDGAVIVTSVGSYGNADLNPTAGGAIAGLTTGGGVLWTIRSQHEMYGYVAIGKGVAFAALDDKLTALNPESGKVLWTYTASSAFYASPVLVPSGVYAVDTAGDVYAFSPLQNTYQR